MNIDNVLSMFIMSPPPLTGFPSDLLLLSVGFFYLKVAFFQALLPYFSSFSVSEGDLGRHHLVHSGTYRQRSHLSLIFTALQTSMFGQITTAALWDGVLAQMT